MRTAPYRRVIRLGRFTTSDIELKDLGKAWIAISFAFAVILKGSLGEGIFVSFLMSALTVGTGFLLHELGHKLLAQKYGCFAEFRANTMMLFLAVLMSFLGFIFAAPGAVMIAGAVSKDKNGKIAFMGPLINLLLAGLFYGISFFFPHPFWKYGVLINSWIALFNMLPFGIFDGYKIWQWNKIPYFFVVVGALAFLILH